MKHKLELIEELDHEVENLVRVMKTRREKIRHINQVMREHNLHLRGQKHPTLPVDSILKAMRRSCDANLRCDRWALKCLLSERSKLERN